MTIDPNRERCGNCGEPWEEHEDIFCDECRQFYRVCDFWVFADNDCSQHGFGGEFRPESDENRIADRARSMRI